MVGGADPFAGGAVDGPSGGGGEEFGGGCRRDRAVGGVVAEAVEEHAADYGDDGRFHVRGELGCGRAVGGGGLGEGLGEEVADAEDHAGEGGGAGAVEDDAALVEEGVEAAGNHAFEEGELVRVVGVEGGAVDARRVGDLLDGELVEVAGAEEGGEGLLEELAGAADARVGGFNGQRRGFDGRRGLGRGFRGGDGVDGNGGGGCHGVEGTRDWGGVVVQGSLKALALQWWLDWRRLSRGLRRDPRE
jgi:hypothetical protein